MEHDPQDGPPEVKPLPKRRRAVSAGTTLAGVMAGIDGQIFRSTPPAHELVHHARRDGAVAEGRLVIHIPPLDDSSRR